ncbi:general secretion pathway protein K [Halopseudomonas xinjiangensis]|uniref:General secretion pathway protein K n=1 Tax=Halopseudomonas xinjiangensis TaxID=487184 RepID=A0A1H1UBG1_9GAMM|nr:type II secretion system protein GspK [Halopseudomonas xinjiangensis]SDS69778.1 general secretion pathway protein K [Halopseudomonas xinjiangensis]
MKPTRQRGIALVTALLVVALATVAAVAMALRGQADIRRTSAVFERDMSRHIAAGAEAMVLQVLEQAGGPDDLPWDTCLSPVLPFEVDGIRLQATLDNMQCRYNVNALAGADEVEQGYFASLVDRASQESGVSMPSGAQLAVAVTDWMNPETDDPVYRLADPPKVSGNRPMITASELVSVSGMTGEAWQALSPYVTAYPGAASAIDLERSSDVIKEVFAERPAPQEAPWYMRLQIVAEFGERRYYQCTLLDAPNGKVVLREQTACEP